LKQLIRNGSDIWTVIKTDKETVTSALDEMLTAYQELSKRIIRARRIARNEWTKIAFLHQPSQEQRGIARLKEIESRTIYL
jgi:predicted Co/Zn/Cd cation transporter (cation efflux family)